MKLRMAALIFGIAFLGAGIAWYFPFFFDNDGLLLGLFQVDSMHNKIHIASGLIALVTTVSSRLSRLYFKIFGSLYGLLGLAGFIMPDQLISMHMNRADHFLHVGIALVALIIGFKMKIPVGE